MAETILKTVEDLPRDWAVTRLADRLHGMLPDLRERYHIDSVAIFGSYVRNEQRPDSDLDLLVTFSRTPTLFEIMHAEDDISEALGVKVDLVLRSGLGPRFSRYVLREAIQL